MFNHSYHRKAEQNRSKASGTGFPIWILLTTICAVFLPAAHAESFDLSANMGLELRGFYQDPLVPFQDQDLQASLFFQPEARWQSADRQQRFSFIGFARWDETDDERSHLDIREFYWSYRQAGWTTTVGINKVFWGVAESVHLIDVINQTDWVEDIDQEDKLGQPMVHLSHQQDWGRLELYVLPWFRERTFPGAAGRLGFGRVGDAEYESSDEEHHLDWALRYSHYFGDVDLGLSVFDGTDREPVLLAREDGTLFPWYRQMRQFGMDLQYTRDAWLWKLEALYRDSRYESFWAAVGGFEYTFYQLKGGDADLGLLLEYQHDDRSTPVLSDNDVFIGARYALNDINDSSVLGGMSVDLDDGARFYNIEAETRLNDHLTAELRVRVFSGFETDDPAYVFSRSDYVQLQLNWFF
jgi:hypothetical protein